MEFDPCTPATWTDEDWAAAFAFEQDGGDVATIEQAVAA